MVLFRSDMYPRKSILIRSTKDTFKVHTVKKLKKVKVTTSSPEGTTLQYVQQDN